MLGSCILYGTLRWRVFWEREDVYTLDPLIPLTFWNRLHKVYAVPWLIWKQRGDQIWHKGQFRSKTVWWVTGLLTESDFFFAFSGDYSIDKYNILPWSPFHSQLVLIALFNHPLPFCFFSMHVCVYIYILPFFNWREHPTQNGIWGETFFSSQLKMRSQRLIFCFE